MKKLLIVISIVICFVIILFVAVYINTSMLKDKKYYVDNTAIKLDKKITSIKEGYSYAKDRAQIWDKNVWLEVAKADFHGEEQIIKRKGQIYYFFNVNDLGLLKLKGSSCCVIVDMDKQIISKFISFGIGEDAGIPPKEYLQNNKIDIDEVFDIVITRFGEENVLKDLDNSHVSIVGGEKLWTFTIKNSQDEMPKRSLFIRIDAENKEIKDYENNDWLKYSP